MDLLKYFEKQNVDMVNRHPSIDSDEHVRSIMVSARYCPSVSPAMACSGRLLDTSVGERTVAETLAVAKLRVFIATQL